MARLRHSITDTDYQVSVFAVSPMSCTFSKLTVDG